jgi:hypothetical protein
LPDKGLRLKGISAIEAANQFLEKACLPKMNRMFPRPAAEPDGAHAQLGNADLKNIMRLESQRPASNGYVIRFQKRLFQILKPNKNLPRPKGKVAILAAFGQTLYLIWKDAKLLVKGITNKKAKQSKRQHKPMRHFC